MDTKEIFEKNEQQSCSSVHMNFHNRQKNLFDQLDKAEEKVKKNIPNEVEMEVEESLIPTNKRKRSETKHLRGKESIFKRPDEPIAKCLPVRTVPDHKKNPHKWVKYSLGDVHNDDMSDKSNTAAALSFLREMEERKTADTNEGMGGEDYTKITFKKRTPQPQFNKSAIVKQDIEEPDEDKASFKGSKFVMPEYVVGQKSKSKKTKVPKDKPNEKVKEIKLDHLLDDEDD